MTGVVFWEKIQSSFQNSDTFYLLKEKMKALSLIVILAVLFEINCLKITNRFSRRRGVNQLLVISFDGFGCLYLNDFLK